MLAIAFLTVFSASATMSAVAQPPVISEALQVNETIQFRPWIWCAENQVFEWECNDPYQHQCSTMYLRNRFWPWNDCKPRCVCRCGLVWSTQLGRCVHPYSCPAGEIRCPPNQIYDRCKNIRPVCSMVTLLEAYAEGQKQIFVPRIPFCYFECIPGCRCANGYVEHPVTRNCIPIRPLFGCVDRLAVYDPCGESCPQPTCARRFPVCYISDECYPACRCRSGYIWSEAARRCVTPAECPKLAQYDTGIFTLQAVPLSP